ncbi:carboxypeptidase regulatory-like domain-containing protein [Roseateles sp. BYS180W]|uniref:Carboxypeptidase regulatory-like domain-containing protein n=1 Tax=Roseateles rivi TaxID=3299028 RepID=A0ABW7FUE3_9BURK
MNPSFRHFTPHALATAVAIVVMAPAMAQNTSSALGGRVLDGAGKPVAGASVAIKHAESGSVNNLSTDAEGRYSVRGLRVGGPYTVTVSKGSERAVRDNVFLGLAETLTLDLTLGGARLETVQVTGTRTMASKIDSAAMGAGTALGRAELEAYASINRNLQDFARIDPRLAQTDKERGEISALGQNARFNAITIDGVRVNDTFGLESNNMPTAKQPISMEAIQAVQVNLSNYDVTQQGYTGANINAVTKSGTNQIKGSLYYVYRDDSMAGQRYNASKGSYFDPPAFKEDTKGFTLGGPIVKDKLFFFANYEELHSTRSAVTFGPVGSPLTNVGITADQIAAAQKVARDVYKIDIGSLAMASAPELVVKDYLLKLDWNINEQHRANLRLARTAQTEPNFTRYSATSMSLSSHWWDQEKTIDTAVVQWFADWTDSFSTEARLSRRAYDSVPRNAANLPQVQLDYTDPAPAGTATGNRSLYFGTENSRQFNVLRTTTWDAYLAGTWLLNDHEVKVGADYSDNEAYNAFLQNTKGSYVFRGSDPAALWAAGVPTSYTVQLPQTGRTLDDGVAQWRMNSLGLFLQDSWKLSKQLNLMTGLRLDRLGVADRPLHNAAAQTKFGYDNSATLDGATLVQPRVGFNYAFEAQPQRKAQLRGGFGLFQGAAANVWLSNPFSNTGMATATLNCSSTTNPRCPADLRFSADPNAQPQISGVPPAANIDFLSPELRQPSVWKSNLAIETELDHRLVLGVEWMLTKTRDGINYRNLNLGAPTTLGPDGRELYYNAAALDNTRCWNTGAANPVSGCGSDNRAGRDKAWGNVLLADRTSQGSGSALTLSLAQNVGALNWSAAYTRTNASEVSTLASSVSFSNWANRASFNPNEDAAAISSTLIQNRFSAAANWSKAFWGSYKTTIGLVYEGRSGRPYSWTYKNDMNGDGVVGNDLMYIPKAPGSGEVLFVGAAGSGVSNAQAEAKFWQVVSANPELDAARGGVVRRNAARSQFVNTFDLRLAQQVPGLWSGHKGSVTFDLMNIGNLLNKRWGRTDEVVFNQGGGNGGYRRGFVNYAGMKDGKYVYAVGNVDSPETRQARGESQWALQITAKYEF